VVVVRRPEVDAVVVDRRLDVRVAAALVQERIREARRVVAEVAAVESC
jgi:hypothetical protein